MNKKDIKLMMEQLEDNYSSEKDAFLECSRPVYNFFVKLTPLVILKKVNKLLYKYDKELFTLELKYDKLYNKYFSWINTLKNNYRKHFSSILSHRIPQAFSYVKVGWYDYDWDYIYLVKILKFKIKRMESYIRQGDRHLNTEYYCDQMKLVVELLSKYLEDSNSVYDELDKLYPEYDRKKDEHEMFCKKTNRHVWLNKYGKKVVTYSSGYRCNEPEGYKKEFLRIYRYYENLSNAYLRVALHIMSPRYYSDREVEKIHEYNTKISNKYKEDSRDLTDEEWKQIESKKIKLHFGLLNWWD